MADDEQLEDGDQSQEAPETDQFGESVEGVARAGRSVGSTAQKAGELGKNLGSNLAKLAGNFVGPLSKIKLVFYGINVGVLLIAFVGIFFGLTMSSLANKGTGGTTPQQRQNLAEAAEKDNLDLIGCLKTAPKDGGDPAKEETIILSDECIQLNLKQATAGLERTAAMKQQVDKRTDDEALRTKIKDLLTQLETEFNGVKNENGKYKETKAHFDKARQLTDQLMAIWPQISCGADSKLLAGLKTSKAPNGEVLYYAGSGSGLPIGYAGSGGDPDDPMRWLNGNALCVLLQLEDVWPDQMKLVHGSNSSGGNSGRHSTHFEGTAIDLQVAKITWCAAGVPNYCDSGASAWSVNEAIRFAKLARDLGSVIVYYTTYAQGGYSPPPDIGTMEQQYTSPVSGYSGPLIDVIGNHHHHWHLCVPGTVASSRC